jgi:hypothetical protein
MNATLASFKASQDVLTASVAKEHDAVEAIKAAVEALKN